MSPTLTTFTQIILYVPIALLGISGNPGSCCCVSRMVGVQALTEARTSRPTNISIERVQDDVNNKHRLPHEDLLFLLGLLDSRRINDNQVGALVLLNASNLGLYPPESWISLITDKAVTARSYSAGYYAHDLILALNPSALRGSHSNHSYESLYKAMVALRKNARAVDRLDSAERSFIVEAMSKKSAGINSLAVWVMFEKAQLSTNDLNFLIGIVDSHLDNSVGGLHRYWSITRQVLKRRNAKKP